MIGVLIFIRYTPFCSHGKIALDRSNPAGNSFFISFCRLIQTHIRIFVIFFQFISSIPAAVGKILQTAKSIRNGNKPCRRITLRKEIILLISMPYPESVISKKCFICTILISICFPFQVSSVSPGHIFIHQCAKILLNIFFHPFTAHFLPGFIRKHLKSRPSVTIRKSRTGNIYHTHRWPVRLNVIQITVILHSPGKKNHFFANSIVKLFPAILIFIFFFNGHQCPCNCICATANFNIKRSVIFCQNTLFHKLRTFCFLRSVAYILDISHFCNSTEVIRRRIICIVYLQIVIYLCIRIHKLIHPVRSHPPKGFCGIISTVMQLGTGLYNSLQINIIRIKQCMNQSIHIIYFPVLGNKKTRLSFCFRKCCYRVCRISRCR